MTAGEHNVAMSMRLYQSIQELFRRLNPAGVRLQKIILTPDHCTVQLEPSVALQSLFTNAVLRSKDGREFYEHFEFDCRLVWGVLDE